MSDLVKHGVAVGDIWDFQAGQDDLWRVDAVDHVTATATLSGCSSKTMGRGCSGFATEHFDRATLRMRPETVTTNVASEAKSVDPLAEYNQHNEASYCVCFSCDKQRAEAAQLGAIIEVPVPPSQLADWYSQNTQAFSQPGAGEQYWTQGGTQWFTPEMEKYTCQSCGGIICLCGKKAWKQPEAEQPPQAALPFKRADGCPLSHDAPVMCLNCEDIIAGKTDRREAARAQLAEVSRRYDRKQPYEPLHGAFVGRVLTPVGR